MKLYTKPRALRPEQLRAGDQIATVKAGGQLIRSAPEYFDHDLNENVAWSVFHRIEGVAIVHTLGQSYSAGYVIMREVIEIEPWTYIRPITE